MHRGMGGGGMGSYEMVARMAAVRWSGIAVAGWSGMAVARMRRDGGDRCVSNIGIFSGFVSG
ncbi:hypothetical protein AMQ84_30110 [Paenibacillus riograndensis]|uniref:Uncharacterized protein n=1 Tax=Paenibacillus riograndensis TaxID=483937 RepID=A0A132TG59_9BACL|nr:hypothetical protein [Paenibacillus riograndensis]KWX70317.1 hypothetical protein AMQ84_30110 [Paenibacillus riograndensis]